MATDYLRECMTDPALVNGPVPIDEFNKYYCLRCNFNECTRSAGSNASFTNRVKNWRRDLFEAPPRAPDDDPSFVEIRSKKFFQVSEQISSVKPKNFESTPVKNPHHIEVKEEPAEVKEEPVKEKAIIEHVEASPSQNIQRTPKNLLNTKYSQGSMVGAPPTETQATVIEPGGTFSFGDDDENK